MSRYRLQPTPAQQAGLLEHCAHARFVWNLAVEQQSWWSPRRGPAPKFAEQCRQLTEARAAFAWLRGGSVTVQQQALRDFNQAMTNFFAGTHRRPTWRKRGQHESQAVFRCAACKHVANADVNAACNIRDIAAGRAVTARGGRALAQPVNREPQLVLLS